MGDTIITPSALAIIDSVSTVKDSVTRQMLGERYTVYAVHLRVRDLYQRDRWFEARPLVIYSEGQVVAGKAAELPALRIKYGLASVDRVAAAPAGHGTPSPTAEKEVLKIGLNVAESEFLVMQAIIFPGINILWIGCVLMFLGTLLAVVQRVRNGSRRKAQPKTGN
ncbi:MAG: hypothetical protein IPO87_18710 [Flavobacteriales bacterium]|nr:hypothetical protein [Flavobacteriales bacterium]